MKRYLSVLMLGATLIVPTVAKADDDDRRHHRYYDRSRRDWHEWNEKEERAYRHYLKEQRRREIDFERAHRRDREQYFRWRHEHPEIIIER
jgi:hypothetical protein